MGGLERSDAEAWDGESWQALPGPAGCAGAPGCVIAVRGGMLRVGRDFDRPHGHRVGMSYFDESLGRWIRVRSRKKHRGAVVSGFRDSFEMDPGMDDCGGFTIERQFYDTK